MRQNNRNAPRIVEESEVNDETFLRRAPGEIVASVIRKFNARRGIAGIVFLKVRQNSPFLSVI